MNLAEVRLRLSSLPPGRRRVWVGDDTGELPRQDNVSVLLRRADGSCFTAYFERGRYHDVRDFADEESACRDFLVMMGLDPSTPT